MRETRGDGHRITMADVAREAGVSKQTVSRVINGKAENSEATRQRVLEVVKRLGYRPSGVARSLATNKTMNFGFIMPNLTNPYFSEIALGAEEAALERGYTLFICNSLHSPEHEEAMLELFEQRGTDGIIMDNPFLADDKLFALLKHHQSAVIIGRKMPAGVAGSITIDDVAGAELAVAHLLKRGRQKLALLAGWHNMPTSQARKRGFISGLKAAGRPVVSDYLLHCHPGPREAYECVLAFLKDHREVDGLVCFNDIVAAGAIKACYKLGIKVPDDLMVIGHDDILLAELMTPSLTTLSISKYDLGVNAVRMLFDRMEGRNQNMEIVFTPELVVRESAP